MNHIFTLKGRLILFLLLIFHVGLKLQASASTRVVCKSDTVKKASNGQLVSADTTLHLKAGSKIVQNADTILIINGIPTKVQINNIVAEKKAAEAAVAKMDDNATAIVAPPSDGIIQVKNTAVNTASTTIVAPPIDGVIQVRNTFGMTTTSNMGNNPNGAAGAQKQNAAGATVTKVKNVTDTLVKRDTTTIVKKDTVFKGAAIAAAAVGLKHDTTTIIKKDTVVKHDTTTIVKKDTVIKTLAAAAVVKPDTTTILKHDTTTIVKRDTVYKRDTTTIVKNDTTNILKKDTTATVAKADSTSNDDFDPSLVKAQNIYLGIGGAGLAISANYDARFGKERNGWGFSVGLGAFSAEGNSVFTIPFQLNYLIGEHNFMFEVGGGATFMNSKGVTSGKTWQFDNITGFIATGTIGFRYQPESKGLTFKAGFVPILYDEGLIPAGGVSIGYTFK